ncbi:DUF4259 domain-containing protein [Streptomyces sp. NPDC020983]|uniref:DUF4259 domain-containing protein n=1 Tax=Streptomyces sp. NPDC020983 TaxID=3365106 RepID=UPI00379564E0
MGTWGAGNFDSDTAADHLGELAGRLVGEVAEAMAGDPVELEPDEYWGVAVPCNLELLLLLKRQDWVGVALPPAETIRAWQETFLTVWERTIDGLGPKPAYKDERRAVLNGTFERLAEASVHSAA